MLAGAETSHTIQICNINVVFRRKFTLSIFFLKRNRKMLIIAIFSQLVQILVYGRNLSLKRYA